MVFGALLPCEECSGQLVFKSDAYYCTGDVTAWTKCMVRTQTPGRKDWATPKVRGRVTGLSQKSTVTPSGLVHTVSHHDLSAVFTGSFTAGPCSRCGHRTGIWGLCTCIFKREGSFVHLLSNPRADVAAYQAPLLCRVLFQTLGQELPFPRPFFCLRLGRGVQSSSASCCSSLFACF